MESLVVTLLLCIGGGSAILRLFFSVLFPGRVVNKAQGYHICSRPCATVVPSIISLLQESKHWEKEEHEVV